MRAAQALRSLLSNPGGIARPEGPGEARDRQGQDRIGAQETDGRGTAWTVGALVQANYGSRELLRVDGVPVGREIGRDVVPSPRDVPALGGSIIAVLATDAPLLPVQC
jgi:hypothetical protein